jgi:hypothetical protein
MESEYKTLEEQRGSISRKDYIDITSAIIGGESLRFCRK